MQILNAKRSNIRQVGSRAQPRSLLSPINSKNPAVPSSRMMEIIPQPLLPIQFENKGTKMEHLKVEAQKLVDAGQIQYSSDSPLLLHKMQYFEVLGMCFRTNALLFTAKQVDLKIQNMRLTLQRKEKKLTLEELNLEKLHKIIQQMEAGSIKNQDQLPSKTKSKSEMLRAVAESIEFATKQQLFDLQLQISAELFQLQTNILAQKIHSQVVCYGSLKYFPSSKQNLNLCIKKVEKEEQGNVLMVAQKAEVSAKTSVLYLFKVFQQLDYTKVAQKLQNFINQQPKILKINNYQDLAEVSTNFLLENLEHKPYSEVSQVLLETCDHGKQRDLVSIFNRITTSISDKTQLNLMKCSELNQLLQEAANQLQDDSQSKYLSDLRATKNKILDQISTQRMLLLQKQCLPIDKINLKLANQKALSDIKHIYQVRVAHLKNPPSLNDMQISDLDMFLALLMTDVMAKFGFLKNLRGILLSNALDEVNNYFEKLMIKLNAIPPKIRNNAQKYQLRLFSIRMQEKNAIVQKHHSDKRKAYYNNVFAQPLQTLEEKVKLQKLSKVAPKSYSSPQRVTKMKEEYNRLQLAKDHDHQCEPDFYQD